MIESNQKSSSHPIHGNELSNEKHHDLSKNTQPNTFEQMLKLTCENQFGSIMEIVSKYPVEVFLYFKELHNYKSSELDVDIYNTL